MNKSYKGKKGSAGVYFLYYNKSLVYIGKSKNVQKRINQHEYKNEKCFNSFNIIYTTTEKEAYNLEQHILQKIYKPFYNDGSRVKMMQTITIYYTKSYGCGYQLKIKMCDKNGYRTIFKGNLSDMRKYLKKLYGLINVPSLLPHELSKELGIVSSPSHFYKHSYID